MDTMPLERRTDPIRILADLIVPWVATVAIAMDIPWNLVLGSTIPTGGDNPAHLVMIRDLQDSFFGHGKIVSYSYSFWSGFELFQSYFTLPYFVAALLSPLIGVAYAFKAIVLFASLALPAAFAFSARWMGMGIASQVIASFLALSFLNTGAHTMWGGNMSSLYAGMIANGWAFVFFVLALGKTLQAWRTHALSYGAILFCTCAVASHFYAILMVFTLYAVIAAEDLVAVLRGRLHARDALRTALNGIFPVLLMAWWLIPLVHYKPFTSEFGGDWQISLLGTFTLIEKAVFGPLLLAAAAIAYFSKGERDLRVLLAFGLVFLAAFFGSRYLSSTAFNNVRLWPSLYLALHLITLVVLDRFLRWGEILWTPVVGIALILLPGDEQLLRGRQFMEWNFSGLEDKSGWQDLSAVLDILNREPPSRVSWEASEETNNALGTVRVFEMLPFLTPHDIVEGGIVASATYPGMGYVLSCLTSIVCAGWPPGTYVPEPDIPRAIEMMRFLGVRYHIATSARYLPGWRGSTAVETLYSGSYLSLFRLKEEIRDVEAFEPPVPTVLARKPDVLLLNEFRYDRLRDSVTRFVRKGEPIDPAIFRVIPQFDYLRFLIGEFSSPRRVFDRGKSDPKAAGKGVTTYLFSWNSESDLEEQRENGVTPFIGDVTFSPWLLVPNNMEGRSEVLIPLVRDEPGASTVSFVGSGYTVVVGDSRYGSDDEVTIEFRERELDGERLPFEMVRLVPDAHTAYRHMVALPLDGRVRSGLPGPAADPVTKRVTERCDPRIEPDFHKLTLTTSCPGLPHLIKYSYYPKWHASVPIYLGSGGYMLVVPQDNRLELRHTNGPIDWAAIAISLLGAAIAGALVVTGSRRVRIIGGNL